MGDEVLVRVAFAKHFDPAIAVARCKELLGAASPTMLLVFCGGKHDPDGVFGALRDAFGPVCVVGGSAVGAITFGGHGYSGIEIGIMGFFDAATTPSLHVTFDLLHDEWTAGRELGRKIADTANADAPVFLLFDSVASRSPPRLHFGSSVVDGFYDGLGAHRVRLTGGGLLTDFNLSDGWVFVGDRVCRHAALALVFPPTLLVETVILHGCRPVSSFMEITRIDGAVVYELDNEPALPVIERMLGLKIGPSTNHNISLVATLGEKHGDPFGPYDENEYVNRLILTSHQADGSVTLFEPDFRQGARVQIMSRDNALMLQSVRDGVQAANRAIAVGDTLLSLYVDCAGRASAMSGAAIEEAEIVAQTLDQSVPFLGFYSGVEIAPFGEYSRPLDWTGMLLSLRRRHAQ